MKKKEALPENTFRIRVISEEPVNIRKGPGNEYEVTTVAYKSEVYTIIETGNANDLGLWGKLKDGSGWIDLSCKYVDMCL